MIPTMILFGLAMGRWWRSALIGSALFLPALGLVGGALHGPADVVLAAGLGMANAAVGIAVHQALLLAARRFG